MSDYERASSAARGAAVSVPDFESVAASSDRDRKAWRDEDQVARRRARRWLLLAAAGWLTWPLLGALGRDPTALGWSLMSALPSGLSLLWAARLSRDPALRSAILSRAIAAANLVFALAAAFFDGNVGWSLAFTVLLAVAPGRSLQLLGERGLDGNDDPGSSFEPVKFRGILILALVMACADALTLLGVATGSVVVLAYTYWFGGYDVVSFWLPHTSLTAAAGAIMVVNVWGLLRLRTWALLSNMVANVAVAALALAKMLATSDPLSIALVVTAGIQLLLPLPILAAALGYGDTLRYERVGAVLLRVGVPAMVLATSVVATVRLLTHL